MNTSMIRSNVVQLYYVIRFRERPNGMTAYGMCLASHAFPLNDHCLKIT